MHVVLPHALPADVSHDDVAGGLVRDSGGDGRERVPQTVEADAVSLGVGAAHQLIEHVAHAVDSRDLHDCPVVVVVDFLADHWVPLLCDEHEVAVASGSDDFTQRVDRLRPERGLPLLLGLAAGVLDHAGLEVDIAPVQIGNVRLTEAAVDAEQHHCLERVCGLVDERPHLDRRERLLPVGPLHLHLVTACLAPLDPSETGAHRHEGNHVLAHAPIEQGAHVREHPRDGGGAEFVTDAAGPVGQHISVSGEVIGAELSHVDVRADDLGEVGDGVAQVMERPALKFAGLHIFLPSGEEQVAQPLEADTGIGDRARLALGEQRTLLFLPRGQRCQRIIPLAEVVDLAVDLLAPLAGRVCGEREVGAGLIGLTRCSHGLYGIITVGYKSTFFVECRTCSCRIVGMDSQVSNPTVAGSKPARCVAPSTTETQEKQGGNAPVPADSASPAKSANVGQTAEHPANESCSPVVAPKTGYGPAYVHFASDYGVCWRWLRTKDQDGYGYFRAGGKHIKAHQHYWRERFGEIPAGMELDHKCRNRWCVNPDHLEPVPHIENCRRGGLVKTGMTIEKAREVRALAAAGVKQKDIAERFGIGKSLVAQIVTNRCWREAALAPADRRAGQQHDAAFSAWRFMHTTPRRQP